MGGTISPSFVILKTGCIMLSAEARSFRQQSRLAISLSWIGGFVNVIAFLIWGTFASHMTGASTLFGMNSVEGQWSEILFYLSLVVSFVAGAVASALMTELAKRRGARSKYILPLTIEALLLTTLMIGLRFLPTPRIGFPHYSLLGITAFAMGLQNATITKISGAVVRSTHLTGVLTDFGIESVQFSLWAWDQLRGRLWRRAGRVLRVSQRHPTFLRIALLASIWGSYVFGTIAGTFLFLRLRELALLAPIGFLLLIILLDWRKPTSDIRELDVLSDPELKLHGLVHTILPHELGLYRLTHDPRHHFRAPNFSSWIDRLPPHKNVVILVMSPLMKFDDTALFDLQAAIKKLEASHRRLIIAGVNPAQYKKMAHEHIVEQIGAANVCPDLEFAIGLGLEIVRDRKDAGRQ